MKSALAIIALIVLQSVGAQTKSPKGTANNDSPPALSKEFQTAGQLAYEAMERLGDYNDKPEISYEPRRLDAEKAIAEAKRKAKTAEDKHASEVLDNWLSSLDTQRQLSPSDGRLSNAATVAKAYGEKSKQAKAAYIRESNAETDHAMKETQENMHRIVEGKPAGPRTPLGSTPALDYWEKAVFPCAVEASWYFGETLTKEGIETAKTSICAPGSKPK
jgi:hypothetical protein